MVLYLGTVVTGSGPHAGDVDSPRNGLDPLQVSQLHADAVFLFVGLTIGLLFAVHAIGRPGRLRTAVLVLLAVELAQGAIGLRAVLHRPADRAGRPPHARRRG